MTIWAMAPGSSWPSASMLTVTSQLVRTSISPQRSAFWWPRFRERAIPLNIDGSSAARSQMISQVASRLPSSTKVTWLAGSTMPSSTSARTWSAKTGAVRGSTDASL